MIGEMDRGPPRRAPGSPVNRGSSPLTAAAPVDPWGLIGPATGMPSEPETVTSLQVDIKQAEILRYLISSITIHYEY